MKRILRGLFSIPAAALLSGYHLRRLVFGEEKAFLSLVERLSRYTGYVGVYLRSAVYSRVLASCGLEVQIGFGTVFTKPKAVIAEHVYIGRYCSLGWVHVEKDVMLADYVAVPSGGATHSLEPGVPPRERLSKSTKLVNTMDLSGASLISASVASNSAALPVAFIFFVMPWCA